MQKGKQVQILTKCVLRARQRREVCTWTQENWRQVRVYSCITCRLDVHVHVLYMYSVSVLICRHY